MPNGLVSWHRNFFLPNRLLSWHRNFFLFLCVVKNTQPDHYPGTHTNKNTIIIRPKIQHTKTLKSTTNTTIKPMINNSNITLIDMRDLMRSPHSNLALYPWTQGITFVISLFRLS
eukprot:398824_1